MLWYLNFLIIARQKWINRILIDNDLSRSWRSGTKCGCKTDWLWVRSPLEEMKYLLKFIFPFLRSGVEAKRGVKLCHLTRNASRIRLKVGNGISYTKFPLLTLLCAGYSMKLIFFLIDNPQAYSILTLNIF